MHVCYVRESDPVRLGESDDSERPSVMVVTGLILRAAAVEPLTKDFIDIKRDFYPDTASRNLDYILTEIKGSNLRAGLGSDNVHLQDYIIDLLDEVFELLDHYRVRLIGRVWIIDPAKSFNHTATYSYAVQDCSRHFDHFLDENNSRGMLMCEARNTALDSQATHSVFTQMLKTTGNSMPRLMEAPVLGRAENYAGLQLSETLASAVLLPVAARVFGAAEASGIGDTEQLDLLRARYAHRLRNMEYWYIDHDHRRRGGLIVHDTWSQLPSRLLLAPAND